MPLMIAARSPSYESWALHAALAALILVPILFGLVRLTDMAPRERPWLKVLGYGFIFNYRVADAYAGFTAVPGRPIPIGTILKAEFENPLGGPPFIETYQVGLPDKRFSLRSPSLSGVQAGVEYALTLSLLDRSTGDSIWTRTLSLRSQIGTDEVPDSPLTIGPGYQRPLPPFP